MNKNIIKYNGQLGSIVNDYNNKEVKRFLPCRYGSYHSKDLEIINFDKVEETSFEEQIKYIEKQYNWGQVIETHTIGEYQIIEAVEKGSNSKRLFSAYLNFKSISCSYYSLDEALVGLLAYKYDGCNSRADGYFCKMIGLGVL